MSPLLPLLAVGVAAVALSSRGRRSDCIDEWARYLAEQEAALFAGDPEGRETYAAYLDALGLPAVAACQREAAAIERSGGAAPSCLGAYRADLRAMGSAELRVQAEAARREGLDGVAACFDALAG